MKTKLSRLIRNRVFTEKQRSFIVGSLLGDASLIRTTCGHAFRAHHGLKQADLVRWKFKILSAFVRTEPRISCTGIYFRTVSHPYFSELSARFYEAGRKVVPIDTLYSALDEFGLAAWLMDDGAADRRQLRINTQSFSLGEVRLLVEFLHDRFSLRGTINFDKGMPRIRIRAGSMPRLRELVEPHFIPSMKYKISGTTASSEETQTNAKTPNAAVKHTSADGSRTAGSLESRSVPD